MAGLSPEDAEAVPLQDVRTPGLANIGETLRQLARFHFVLPEGQVGRIGEWMAKVNPRAQMSMSERNRRRLGALVEPRVSVRLLVLPRQLMRRAEQPGQRPRANADRRHQIARQRPPGEKPGRLRRSPAPAWQPDGLVHRRRDRGLESRASDDAGRTARTPRPWRSPRR